MTAQTRPRRERKGDRLLAPGCTKEEIMVDYAVAPFDRIAREMDNAWGVDRLPELVTPALSAKFGAAVAYLNEAISANDPDKAAAAATNCIKGLRAMDAEARSLGRQPLPADVWVHQHEGRTFAVMRETGDWTTLQATLQGIPVYSLREVALAMESYKSALPIVDAVKKSFPGAEVGAVRSKLAEELEDEIPW